MSAALNQFPTIEPAGLVAADQLYVVRRNGGRPLTFAGAELCSAMSYEPGTPLWYEISIYRTSTQAYVGSIKMFSKSEAEKDRFAACEGGSLDEVLMWLETYEPAHDIRADLPIGDSSVSVVELGIKAASVSMKLSEARRQYGDLLGEVLYAVERR
jgi:hypothetical protein